MFEQQRVSPPGQFAILIGLVAGFFLIGSMITIMLACSLLHVPITAFLNGREGLKLLESNENASRVVQVVSTFCMFVVPAVIFSLIVEKKKAIYELGFYKKANSLQFLLVLLMGIAGFFVSNSLSGINDMIPLPKSLETTFKAWENNYNEDASAMLNMTTINEYIISVIIIALLPAIFEEMLFRGCLQKVMIGVTRSVFWGILITSILFSIIHGSYYGFLPRLFLSGMLGYIYYYGRNIWLNILVHFFNNALAVTLIFLTARQGKSVQDSMSDDKLTVLAILVSGTIGFIALYYLFVYFIKESKRVYATETIKSPVDTGINNLL